MKSMLSAQTFDWIPDETKGYDIPIGQGTYEQLEKGEFYSEMLEYYQAYHPDNKIVEKINNVLEKDSVGKALTIEIVFGAWCGDSKEFLPQFYKLLQALPSINEEQISLFACDRKKKTGSVDTSDLKIELVPTFVFYISGKEAGRIVEVPERSIEADFLKVIKKSDSR